MRATLRKSVKHGVEVWTATLSDNDEIGLQYAEFMSEAGARDWLLRKLYRMGF